MVAGHKLHILSSDVRTSDRTGCQQEKLRDRFTIEKDRFTSFKDLFCSQQSAQRGAPWGELKSLGRGLRMFFFFFFILTTEQHHYYWMEVIGLRHFQTSRASHRPHAHEGGDWNGRTEVRGTRASLPDHLPFHTRKQARMKIPYNMMEDGIIKMVHYHVE